MLSHLAYSGGSRIASAVRMRAADQRRREARDRLAARAIVIEHVHPDNLGVLPPSPAVLDAKAWLLGLS